ncbi:hypothetical protein MTP99_007765 [Tenebrio molitor]|nr:hypothetical protein MTP99_007765 [Tenebrio molitor]
MSGGGNKKKPTKIQGWEEAGSEFYQESYPTDAEFDAFQRDPNPKHLATLLPSKQTRAAATIRIRTNDTRTIRRQTSSRSRRESTVHRGTATTADVQVSMLPDLSENLSNEQTTWEEIMQIKSMPVPMSQKKEMKAKILNEPNLRLQGYEQLNWKRRKIWRHFVTQLKEFNAKLELWKGDLKRIEVVPIAYSFSEVQPSSACGPFQDLHSVWYRVEVTFSSAPVELTNAISFLTTAGFAVPVFLVLFLLLYYFRAVNSANRQMVVVLKNQLVLEGHDKQFLLERLSKFIKQQQEYQKRLRPVDVLHDGDTNISSN